MLPILRSYLPSTLLRCIDPYAVRANAGVLANRFRSALSWREHPLDRVRAAVRWDRCAQICGRSESDRWHTAMETLPLEDWVDIAEDVFSMKVGIGHQVSQHLERKGLLQGPGIPLGEWVVGGHFQSPWFIAPFLGRGPYLHWCMDEQPSEWGDDWHCDPLDAGFSEDACVLSRGGYTCVRVESGVTLLTTSFRVDPRELRSRNHRG